MTAAPIMRPNPLDQALRFLAMGFSVIPIKPRDKRPALPTWKEYQGRKATEAEIRAWFANPELNVGLVTGEVSRIVAVDADSADAMAWMLANHPSPVRGLTAKGAHFLFRHPGFQVRNGAKLGGMALDIRGDGGYIVAPGSVHPTGALYKEEGDWTAEPPIFEVRWLGGVQPLVKPQAALERRVQAYLDAIPGAPEGQRDNDAFRVACKLVREFALPDETAMAYLGQWNARCTPPLPATDLRRILASAVKSGSAAFGSKLESQTWVDSAVPVDDGGPGDLRDQLVKTEKGGIKRTPGNLAKILRLDSRWGSHLALNEMSRDLLFKGKVVGDTFVDWVQEQIEDHWGTSWGRDDVAQKLFAQASLQIIHPVRVWLRGLEWDRTERIHRVAQEILGSDSPMATHYLRCTLVGATRRVLYPGTKMDTLPVLEGPQGLGKSTFWRTLAGPKWFSDSPINLEDKDGMMTLHRKWCTELSEIDHATGNKAAERIKAFLSSSEDVFRPPFGKAVQVFPRSCFMVGTTNREGFLVDPSGSRRFWPIKCTKVDQTLLGEWRDQLWAEAMYIHSAGVPHWLDKGQEWLREGEAGQFEAADPWDEQIDTAVKARVLAGKDLSEGYSAAELLDQMGIPVAQQTRALEMRLTALLRKKEWSRRQIGLSRHRRWFP